jgi:membrane protein implicated in regulation of membrane protease activity
MLSFSVPVLTALAGYFVLQWGNLSIPLLATSICAALFLFSIFVLLWLILLPRGLNSAQGEPAAYFTNAFYLNSMDDILKGNIQTLQQCINQDMAILNFRGNLLRAAVVLFPVFPFFTVIVWALVSAFTNC